VCGAGGQFGDHGAGGDFSGYGPDWGEEELKPRTPLEMRDYLVSEWGDQAYHAAVEGSVVAVNLRDVEGAKLFAAAAKILIREGFHKKPKSEIATREIKP
jgi:hypothetical protein